MGWITLAIYIVGYLTSLKLLPSLMLRMFGLKVGETPEPEDQVFAMIMAFLVSLLWPIVAIFLIAKKFAWPGGIRVRPTKEESMDELKRKLAAAERRAEKLARENDLPWPK